MKVAFYFTYAVRSLLRGGQRTLLAIFCITVGVMSIVALQAVGQMINSSFTGNIRAANGGDITLTALGAPLKQRDLAFFDQLKKKHTIKNYTALMDFTGSTKLDGLLRQTFLLRVVNPANFPLTTPPQFITPNNGRVSDLLVNSQVIVDQVLANQYGKKVGDTFSVHAVNLNQTAITLHVKIVGIVNNTGAFSQQKNIMVLSIHDFQRYAPHAPKTFNVMSIVTTNKAMTQQASAAIQNRFPLVDVQTTDDVLKDRQAQVDVVKKFLEIAGLLALLIGGVGIINTMQVLLSRRKMEIAMLKTVGYRRLDLYLLFGIEAGLLGIIGGVLGALAAMGVSYLMLNLVQQLSPIVVTFYIDPFIIAGGVLIGLSTALIFGLMPIVRAANIRPLNVIRDLGVSKHLGSIVLTIGLFLLLSVLFCAMSIFILGDITLGISAVYGTFVCLVVLSFVFGLVILILGKLPVPERFNLSHLALVVACMGASAWLYQTSPTFGLIMLAISAMGALVVLLPRSWKVNTKMALRNIARHRARTITTMLALFVGVFAIGLILVVGQNLRSHVDNILISNQVYNVIAVTRGADARTLRSKLSTIPGVVASHVQQRTLISIVPMSIDKKPLQTLLPHSNSSPSIGSLGRTVAVIYLSSLEGYDVAHHQLPDSKSVQITEGRNLNASDAGKHHILISWNLVHLAPFKGHLKLGSKLLVASQDGRRMVNFTVVGVYASTTPGSFGTVLTTADMVKNLAAGHASTVFYMKVDPDKTGPVLDAIGRITPNAVAINLANLGNFVDHVLSEMLVMMTAIATLSLLAGVIIIANAVALAMMERKREVGILKAVGYTSRTILSEVLIENSIVGGTGALLAMLIVTLAVSVLSRLVFKPAFSVDGYVIYGLIIGIALIATITALIMSWRSVRIRPLEVLRYE